MNFKISILMLLKISVSYATICININSKCQNYARYCNMPKFSSTMMVACPATCGVCVRVEKQKQPVSNALVVKADNEVKPIGPCLNGMCPENHVCIEGKCYRLKVTSPDTSPTTSSNKICFDMITVCPQFVNLCSSSSHPNVPTYCPATCNVCVIGKK
uniref:ShKT domain-containing protein n=1 Tax=Strongyloides stercoralis TaxID=6248 RepID=A0A0K0E2Y7_STRER